MYRTSISFNYTALLIMMMMMILILHATLHYVERTLSENLFRNQVHVIKPLLHKSTFTVYLDIFFR